MPSASPLPIPPHYDPETVDSVWRVPYQDLAGAAAVWAGEHGLQPAIDDPHRILLLLVDVQNTFCIPDFELYVGGASGRAAVEDNQRLCAFIYRHLDRITRICPTMDTHRAAQIFHGLFFVDDHGKHPEPFSLITRADIDSGKWRFNRQIDGLAGVAPDAADRYLRHYVRTLGENGKYDLTVWPYHAMVGGIGHALVSAVESAVFFHSMARISQPDIQLKGEYTLTEHYSVLSPEVTEDETGRAVAGKNTAFIERLLEADAVIIAGQAKSHCVAWTVADLLSEIRRRDPALAEKIYLLEDCTSPIVIPGVADYTDEAAALFRQFADAGMHVVKSSDPMESWLQVA